MSCSDTTPAERRWTITMIRAANALAGAHFFERATMRFFRSQVLRTVYQGPGGIFFVTSEEPPYGGRRYTVRRFDPTDPSDIETFGDFCELGRAAAITLAKLAAGKA